MRVGSKSARRCPALGLVSRHRAALSIEDSSYAGSLALRSRDNLKRRAMLKRHTVMSLTSTGIASLAISIFLVHHFDTEPLGGYVAAYTVAAMWGLSVLLGVARPLRSRIADWTPNAMGRENDNSCPRCDSVLLFSGYSSFRIRRLGFLAERAVAAHRRSGCASG